MDLNKGCISNGSSPKMHNLRENDVLIGRGSPSVYHKGNILFRKLIENRLMDFIAAGNEHDVKNEIAQSVISQIYAKDGRFLRRTKDRDRALILVQDNTFLLEKSKQVFRDLAKRAQIRLSDRKRRARNKAPNDMPNRDKPCQKSKNPISDQLSERKSCAKDPKKTVAKLKDDRIITHAVTAPELLIAIPAKKNGGDLVTSVGPLSNSSIVSPQFMTTGTEGCQDMNGSNQRRQLTLNGNYQSEARSATDIVASQLSSIDTLIRCKNIPTNIGNFTDFTGINQPRQLTFTARHQAEAISFAARNNVATRINAVDTLFDSSIVNRKQIPTGFGGFVDLTRMDEQKDLNKNNEKNQKEASQPDNTNSNNIDYRNYSAHLLQMQIERRRRHS